MVKYEEWYLSFFPLYSLPFPIFKESQELGTHLLLCEQRAFSSYCSEWNLNKGPYFYDNEVTQLELNKHEND